MSTYEFYFCFTVCGKACYLYRLLAVSLLCRLYKHMVCIIEQKWSDGMIVIPIQSKEYSDCTLNRNIHVELSSFNEMSTKRNNHLENIAFLSSQC